MSKTFFLAAALAAVSAAPAAAQALHPYYLVDEASVMIELRDAAPPAAPPAARAEEQGTLANLAKIVNLMDKVFDVVSKNQPSIDISTKYANAVPADYKHWSQLQGWSVPSTRKYSFKASNGLGNTVVKVDYQVHWVHGGNHKGRGKYLTGVTVEPVSVTAAYGYKVTLAAEVPESTVMNAGTEEDPVAAMQVKLRWTIHTAAREIRQQAIYYVRGDGLLVEIGSPFENARAARLAGLLDGHARSSFH